MLLFSDGAGGFVDLAAGASPAPSAAIFRGQRAAADAPGPEPDPVNFIDASITSFLSPSGTQLAPLGSGRWICVDKAAAGGGDGKSWATAFNTISAAENIATVPGDVVVIKNGTYRERVLVETSGTQAAPIRFVRYGTHTPRVTGAEVLTGWTACTDQADALGSPQWANCYKAFVPAADVIGTTGDATASKNGICLGLMQDQVKLRLAIDGPGFTDAGLTTAQKQDRAYNRKNDSWFYSDAGASVSYDSGNVLITNTTALGSRTAAGLTHAWLMAHFDTGNGVRHLKITSFNEGTDTATCKNTYGEASFDGSIAILNAGEDLTFPGFWVFSDTLEGDGTRKVVVYPYDGVDLTSAGTIEYCKRGEGVCLTDRAWITVYGIDVDSVYPDHTLSSNGWGFGIGLALWNGSNKIGWRFEECSAQNISSENGYGGGFGITRAQYCAVQNCTANETENQGISLMGLSSSFDTFSRISQNNIRRTFNSGIRPHSVRKVIVDFNTIEDIVSSHANGLSIYGPGSDDSRYVLVFGNKIRTGQGIGLTHQESTDLWFICNDVQTPAEGGRRGIEDNGTGLVYESAVKVLDGVIVTMNNTAGPQTLAQDATAGIIAYKTGGTSHIILNNAAHGVEDPLKWDRSTRTEWAAGDLAKWLEVSNNVSTVNMAPTSDYTTGRSYTAGTAPNYFDQRPAMANNVNAASIAACWIDIEAEDYRPVASGPLDGTGLPPASSVNSALLFPDVTEWGFAAFDFDRDCDGNPLDWSDPPIGAYVVP